MGRATGESSKCERLQEQGLRSITEARRHLAAADYWIGKLRRNLDQDTSSTTEFVMTLQNIGLAISALCCAELNSMARIRGKGICP